MSFDILKDEIKKGKFRNLYLFYGNEEYLKKYYVDSIENSLLQQDLKAMNKLVFQGKTEAAKLIDACETLPVFSDKRLVLVKDSGFFKLKKKTGDEAKGKGKSDELIAFLQNVPEHVCLIFYEEEIDKRIKLVDCIKKNGLIAEFQFQKPAELVKWVIKVFKSYNKDIDSTAASQLVENSELGMTEILSEINKIVLYLGDRSMATGKDIENVCTKSVKSRIFDLTDAISEKNASKALKLLDDMIILKEPVPKILYMITRQFRLVLEMKLLRQEGLSLDQAASRIGLTTYAAGKIARQGSGFEVQTLKQAIKECLEYDISVKTGKIHDRMAAELLITKFSN